MRNNLQIIQDLEQSGELKNLIKAGLFPAKIIQHKEIYFYVTSKTHVGIGKGTAVTWASDLFEVSESQVYKILRSFNS